MKISIWKLISLLFLFILLAFFIYLYSRIEYVEKEIYVGLQGTAARNPLFAAGRLIERYGASAHYVPAYSKPPKSGTTLIFTAPRDKLSAEQSDALSEWVETEGVHLIVSPLLPQHRSKNRSLTRELQDRFRPADYDPLLTPLGISVIRLPDSDNKEQQPQTGETSGTPDTDDTTEVLRNLLQQIDNSTLKTQAIRLPDGTRLNVRFDPQLRLIDLKGNSDWQISSLPTGIGNHKQEGNYGLSYVLGKGRITVLANLDFIKNDMIGEDDHAALFAYAVSLAKGQDIWLVYGNDAPTLWRWLADNAWATLIAAALLLTAWLWMASRHFGPFLPARSAARRSIVEHVAASARYLWRRKQGQTLYRTLCDDFHKRAFLRHPQWCRLPEQELNRQIVFCMRETQIPQLSSLTEHAVESLLDVNRPRNKNQFAADSHFLDILRNKL